jgi:hypothetical protein
MIILVNLFNVDVTFDFAGLQCKFPIVSDTLHQNVIVFLTPFALLHQ